MPLNVRGVRISQNRLKLRNQLWPNLDEKRLWNRKQRQGFTTIPRTMPLFLQIMDSLSDGQSVATAYLDLWCRAHDECFVVLNKHQEMAFSAGYTGQRAINTWRSRLRLLAQLKFIDLQAGPSGEFSYALIWNPYLVVKDHKRQNPDRFPKDLYNALIERANEIGANDLDEEYPSVQQEERKLVS